MTEMTPEPSGRFAAARSRDAADGYRRASRWLALATAGIAALTLLGWAFGINRLTSLSSEFASMKVTTAIGLLCSAGSLLLLHARPARHSPGAGRAALQPLACVLASGAGVLGLGTLVGYAANLDAESTHPGWMSPASALGFTLLALALLTCRTEGRWGRRISEWSTLSVLFIGTVALIGYLYNEQSLYSVKPYASMALHTALSFVLLSLGLLAAAPDRGVMATIAAQEPGGLLIRRLLPLIAAMVVAIGWIRLAGEQLGWFDRSFGLTLVVGLSLAGFSAALWAVARRLNRMAATLRESEARLRFSLEACGIGAWDIDLLDHRAFRSLEHDRIFGYETLLRSWTLDDFLRHALPEYHEPVVTMVKEATAARTGWTYECQIRRADGAIRWIWFSGRFYTDDRGHDRVAGVVQDITERKQAEQAVAEQRRLYQSVTDNASVALFIMDERQQCAFMNPAAEKLTGYSLAETQGRPLHDVVHHTRPDGRPYPLSECPIDQAFPEENQMQGEEVFVHKDGRFYPVAFTASPIRDEAGKAVGTIIEVQDISRRKRAEAALRESEKRLRLALAGGRMGTWDVNLLTGETDWDATEFELLGLTPETTTPSHDAFYRRVHPEDVARVKAAVGRAVEGGGELEHEFRIVRADGTIRWLVGKGLVLKDEQGRPHRMVGINYDITDRKEAEATLRSFARELEARVEDRTRELVQSEERLRALAAELNLVEQRERRRLATELHDYLQQTLVLGKLKLGQGKKAAELSPAVAQIIKETDEVLSEALQYTRTLVAELSPPVLRDHGLPSALKWLADYMQKHDLSVTVGVPEGLDLALPDDQALLLFQSVRELLMNSWKYAGTGEARITMDRRADVLRIEVADSGKGFDVSAAGTDASNGGLSTKFGLFSIRERMRTLGGSFDIQSAPGKGTTATLTLPLGGSSAAETLPVMREALCVEEQKTGLTNASRITDHASRIRVLLVDDHAMVRQGLRSVLESYDDVQVVGEAPDGAAAVVLVGELRPHVAVIDINMPRMNGIDATARIKTNWPETVVIGLSVNAGADNREAMLRAGAALLLTKEAAVEELYGAIRQAVSD